MTDVGLAVLVLMLLAGERWRLGSAGATLSTAPSTKSADRSRHSLCSRRPGPVRPVGRQGVVSPGMPDRLR